MMNARVRLTHILVLLATLTIAVLMVRFWYHIVSWLNDYLPYNKESNDLLNHQAYKKVIFTVYSIVLSVIVFYYLARKEVALAIKVCFVILYIFWLLKVLRLFFAVGLLH